MPRSPRRMTLVIDFEKPKNVSHSELRAFIIDTLEAWGGQKHPDDPLFGSLIDVRVSKSVIPYREPGT